MIIDIDEKKHIYFVNGEIAGISITELLAKHGLSPDYSLVKKNKLKEKAEFGKKVHKDLENICNKKDYVAETEHGKNFVKWLSENIDCGVAEQKLAFEYNGMIICGTADFMGITKDGELVIADQKTTFKIYRESVSWQVSLLDYFAKNLKEPVNGKVIKWSGAKKFLCLHYDKDGKLEVIELESVPEEEIERLIECEYKGEKYQRPCLVVDKSLEEKFLCAEKELLEIERKYKEAQTNAKKIREEILKLFEEQNIRSWENENIKVSYVCAMEKNIVDSSKLKQKYPLVYMDCQKLSKVNSSIRIKLKGDFEDEV